MFDSFESMAQNMVEATSRLVSGRTVNVMDTRGIILASTEKSRIGTLHAGAAEAARTGKPVFITRESVLRYPGAKEGCNMPVFDADHRLIAVVGIYGDPDEVTDAANLLAVYTNQYFTLKADKQRCQAEDSLRSRLLGLLISPDEAGRENVIALCESLGIRLEFPVRVALLEWGFPADSLHSLQWYSDLLSRLNSGGLISPRTDISAVIEGRLTILKSELPTGIDEWLGQLYTAAESFSGQKALKICSGCPCERLQNVHRSYAQAHALIKISGNGISCIDNPVVQCRYLLDCTGKADSGYIDYLLERLIFSVGKNESTILLATAERYYENGCSVTRAAEQLHIHKNTLQYRIRRMVEQMGLEGCSAFEKEFLLRLCIGRQKSLQGR